MAGSIRGAQVALPDTLVNPISTDKVPVKRVVLTSASVINLHAVVGGPIIFIIPANTPFPIDVNSPNEVLVSGTLAQVVRWMGEAAEGAN